MPSFLDQVIDRIKAGNQNDYSNIVLVFPTRRAGIIFRKKFAQSFDQPVFSPAVYSINDFIAHLSSLRIAERMELLLELYEVYTEFYPETPYEKFAPWGEMLLKDFDQADKALADVSMLFTAVKEIKEIENIFQPGTEEALMLSEFWKNFFHENLSLVKTNFLHHWNMLHRLYLQYKKNLLGKNIAYEGLACRILCEQEKPLAVQAEKIYFAGFYLLTNAERKITGSFVEQKKGEMLWDADAYYTDDRNQEAGLFFRKNPATHSSFQWKEKYFEAATKNIHSTGVALQEGQAKYLGSQLSRMMAEDGLLPDETAVVLPDEKLLFPVLYSLPPEISSVNVTMGFPFSISQPGQFIQLIVRLYREASISEKKDIAFRAEDVKELVSHIYFSRSANQLADEFSRIHQSYFRKTFLNEKLKPYSDFTWFRIFNSFNDVFDFLLEVFIHLRPGHGETVPFSAFQSQVFDYTINGLNDLKKTAAAFTGKLSVASAWQIIRDYLLSSKIPFSGEPVNGLQVMGFLETRVLDFKNVFILSCNEGILPRSGKESSYIPYSIRKSFGLPVYDQQDAIAAYHFYRLIQRAENVFLVYNTEVNSFSGGEKSRFLLQLEQELAEKTNNSSRLEQRIAGTDIGDNTIFPITIEKKEDVQQLLKKYLVPGADQKQGKFSASSLSSYIYCRLQFYFRHIAGIREEEAEGENMDDATFGKVFHHAMQKIYENYSEAKEELYPEMLQKSIAAVDEGFGLFFASAGTLEGRNILLREIIIDLVHKVLLMDKKRFPFNLVALEKTTEAELELSSGKKVIIKGIIDRIEQAADQSARIVDYKTGKAEIRKKFRPEKITDSESKSAFQLLLYSWLLDKTEPGKKITACIYPLTRISGGADYLFEGNAVSADQLLEFENALRNLVEEIFDPALPFSQTDDLKKCEYCPYRTICNR